MSFWPSLYQIHSVQGEIWIFEYFSYFDRKWPLGDLWPLNHPLTCVAISPLILLTKFDIKLDGLSMIQKDIGRAMSFTKYRARRAASSMIFLKLIARSISLSIVRKNPSNFIIIMFKIRYFCILTDITNRYYCVSVSWEHNNVLN